MFCSEAISLGSKSLSLMRTAMRFDLEQLQHLQRTFARTDAIHYHMSCHIYLLSDLELTIILVRRVRLDQYSNDV